MSSNHENNLNYKFTGKDLPASFSKTGFALLGLGLVLVILSFAVDPLRAAFNSVLGFTFMLSIGVGSLFMVALEFIAGAVWSTPFRRISENLSILTFVAIIFAIPVILNLHSLYHWTHTEAVLKDELLNHKKEYLDEQFFYIRTALFFIIMGIFYFVFISGSNKQDSTGDQKITKRNIIFSAPFMFIFAIMISLMAIDYLMSLEPHWFSTIFGVYYFAGTFLSAIATLTLFVLYLKDKGLLPKQINKNHLYNLGGLMFAFTAFWTYIAFSQFVLIWYANLPEETLWFIPRMENGWEFLSIGLIFIHFIIPFGMLIQRKAKMNPGRLKLAAYWILFAHVYDLYWLIMPTYSHTAKTIDPTKTLSPQFSWFEIAFPILVAGVVITVFGIVSKNKSLIPIGDPKLQRGLDFHL